LQYAAIYIAAAGFFNSLSSIVAGESAGPKAAVDAAAGLLPQVSEALCNTECSHKLFFWQFSQQEILFFRRQFDAFDTVWRRRGLLLDLSSSSVVLIVVLRMLRSSNPN
jgi:hypothetical protein